MHASRLLAASLLVCALSAPAQTYTPKAIQLQGADSMDQAEIMRLVDLKPGAPVTKEQIEAAMQRLADSGLFANLGYRVDTAALVFMLEPTTGTQAQAVRFTNFVWWRPGELEPLLQARVPLFQGKLPVTGQLTTQVEAALVALLAEKGVKDAKVEAMQSTVGGSGLALTVTQPSITLGDVHLEGVAPETADQIKTLTARLAGRDFDSTETPNTIMDNTLDTHRNAGYLDAVVDPPRFSPPHQAAQGYTVDATAIVHPNPLYRITAVTFVGVDPGTLPEISRASGLKVGDPAGQMNLRIAAGLTTRAFSSRGRLEANTSTRVVKDAAAHTVAYTLNVVPGPVYTFAAVNTAGISADAAAKFNNAFHAKPGVVADNNLRAELAHGLQAAGVAHTAVAEAKLDREAHTVTYMLVSKTAANIQPDTP